MPPERPADAFRQQAYGSVGQDAATLRALAETAAVQIEARGTFCPEPVIRVQDRVREMQPGQIAVLLADDAGVELDIPAWCISTANEYLGLIREERYYCVLVRKAAP